MATSQNTIRFLLNNELIELSNPSADLTLLDYLRIDRRLTGTKEGCAEGDCGACTVLIGRLQGEVLNYHTLNACICFVAMLDGAHVVSVEHIADPDGVLHPVQAALVEHHGSQCGFCTPGIVMSLYALWMNNSDPQLGDIDEALQGNLCRCTGYEPIVRAAKAAATNRIADRLQLERSNIIKQLKGLQNDNLTATDDFFVPKSSEQLLGLLEQCPQATLVSGATDVGLWVTKHMREISPAIFLYAIKEIQQIQTDSSSITLGASVTYSQAAETIAAHYPQGQEFWMRIGGQQVRNMGTIGGNIANGSPIGDSPPMLIALGASLNLVSKTGMRTILLEDYFIDYGKQDLQMGEFVHSVRIPVLKPADRFAIYKISKRFDEDISSICAAFWLQEDESGLIRQARLAFGGMAATPKRAQSAENELIGQIWSEPAITAAMKALAADFTPLSDWRASAEYRIAVAQNLLKRFFLESEGEPVRLNRDRQTSVAAHG